MVGVGVGVSVLVGVIVGVTLIVLLGVGVTVLVGVTDNVGVLVGVIFGDIQAQPGSDEIDPTLAVYGLTISKQINVPSADEPF